MQISDSIHPHCACSNPRQSPPSRFISMHSIKQKVVFAPPVRSLTFYVCNIYITIHPTSYASPIHSSFAAAFIHSFPPDRTQLKRGMFQM